jgi:hypothetical protein
MSGINPRNVINLLEEEFGHYQRTATTLNDRLLADGIAQLIRQCVEAPAFSVECEETLELGDGHTEEEELDDGAKRTREVDPLSEEQLEECLQYYRSTKTHTRTLQSMNAKYRYFKGAHHLRQMFR